MNIKQSFGRTVMSDYDLQNKIEYLLDTQQDDYLLFEPDDMSSLFGDQSLEGEDW